MSEGLCDAVAWFRRPFVYPLAEGRDAILRGEHGIMQVEPPLPTWPLLPLCYHVLANNEFFRHVAPFCGGHLAIPWRTAGLCRPAILSASLCSVLSAYIFSHGKSVRVRYSAIASSRARSMGWYHSV